MRRLFHQSHRRPDRLNQAFAAMLAAMVLLLALLAVCPAAHEGLHADADHEDHECVVTLFAHGITPALAVVLPAAVAAHFVEVVAPVRAVLHLVAPRYRLRPERGPPLG